LEKIDLDYYKKYEKEKGYPPGEYLVDFCAWKGTKFQYELDFILEEEWQPERPGTDLDVDFYKLLDIKARLKIGLGGCSKEGEYVLRRDEVDILLNNFKRFLQNSPWKSDSDEGYLFIFRDNFAGGGITGHIISSDGQVRKDLTPYSYTQLAEGGHKIDPQVLRTI